MRATVTIFRSASVVSLRFSGLPRQSRLIRKADVLDKLVLQRATGGHLLAEKLDLMNDLLRDAVEKIMHPWEK